MSGYFKSNEVRRASLEAYNATQVETECDFDHGAFMSNEEIARCIEEYDELSFTDMPSWLRYELRVRGITFQKRQPTQGEREETDIEAKTIRIEYNNTTIDDLWLKYGEHK